MRDLFRLMRRGDKRESRFLTKTFSLHRYERACTPTRECYTPTREYTPTRDSYYYSPYPPRVYETSYFRDDHRLPDPIYYSYPYGGYRAGAYYNYHAPRPDGGYYGSAHEHMPEIYAKRRSDQFPLKGYHTSYTPYAPYKNVHSPLSKRVYL